MLFKRFVCNAQLHTTARLFTNNNIMQGSNQTQKNIKTEKQNDGIIGSYMHHVSKFDRRLLVWVKRYPNIAAVPKDVTVDCILAARSKARIKICNYMIVATIIGCISAVILGKKQAGKGETLIKLRDDWYQETLEKGKEG